MEQSIIDLVEAIKRGYIGAGNVVGLAKDIPDKKDFAQSLWIMAAAANDGFVSDNLASAAQAIESHFGFDIFDDIEEQRKLLVSVISSLIEAKQETKADDKKELPKWAQSVEASTIFDRLEDAEYCKKSGNVYRWMKAETTMFAYFVELVSDKLKLRQSNGKLDWDLIILAFDNITPKNKRNAQHHLSKVVNEYATKPKEYDTLKELIYKE